jgi:hypothetical protein
MEVEIKPLPAPFNPFELSIKVESQQEALCLLELFSEASKFTENTTLARLSTQIFGQLRNAAKK